MRKEQYLSFIKDTYRQRTNKNTISMLQDEAYNIPLKIHLQKIFKSFPRMMNVGSANYEKLTSRENNI